MLTKASAIEKLSALSLEQLQTVMAFVDIAMPDVSAGVQKRKVKLGVLSHAEFDDNLFDKLDDDVLAMCKDYI